MRKKLLKLTAWFLSVCTLCTLIAAFPVQVSAVSEQAMIEALGGPIAEKIVTDKTALKEKYNQSKTYEATFSLGGSGIEVKGKATCDRSVSGADIDSAYYDAMKENGLNEVKLNEALKAAAKYEYKADNSTMEGVISILTAVLDGLGASAPVLQNTSAENAVTVLTSAGTGYGIASSVHNDDIPGTVISVASAAASIASLCEEGLLPMIGEIGGGVLAGISIVYNSIQRYGEDVKRWNSLVEYTNNRRLLANFNNTLHERILDKTTEKWAIDFDGAQDTTETVFWSFEIPITVSLDFGAYVTYTGSQKSRNTADSIWQSNFSMKLTADMSRFPEEYHKSAQDPACYAAVKMKKQTPLFSCVKDSCHVDDKFVWEGYVDTPEMPLSGSGLRMDGGVIRLTGSLANAQFEYSQSGSMTCEYEIRESSGGETVVYSAAGGFHATHGGYWNDYYVDYYAIVEGEKKVLFSDSGISTDDRGSGDLFSIKEIIPSFPAVLTIDTGKPIVEK